MEDSTLPSRGWPLRKRLIAVATIGVLCAICLLFSERRLHLDLNSGRERFQRRIGPLVISSEIRETEFSRIDKAPVDEPGYEPEWRKVYATGTFSSPVGAGILSSKMKNFAILCDELAVSEAESRELARRLIVMLREGKTHPREDLVDQLREVDRNSSQPEKGDSL